MALIKRWYQWQGHPTTLLRQMPSDLEFIYGEYLWRVDTAAHGQIVGYEFDDASITATQLDAACALRDLYPLADPTTEPTGIYARVTTLEAALAAIPAPQYIRLERDAALSVSEGAPEIPFDATAEASSAWTRDSGAAKWAGAANTPVRGHASVKVSGLLAVLSSLTVTVWKNRGVGGEKLLGEVARKLSLGLGDVETVQVNFRCRVSSGDKISVEAVPNGILAPSLVVGGATHLEIG